ncbi:MAG: GDP-mannose 4,6-dehydratase [Candidatus Bathyarchaeota archaeon]|nr:GDP-mannose 4,6-dehydratase [Candidatus Bathyarchaeota archaeon]
MTGGAGFIGSEVVKQFCQQGAKVSILDNFSSGKKAYLPNSPNVTVINGDICDKPLVKKIVQDCEIIIHIAALPFIPYSYNSPEEFFRVNVMGTLNVLCEAINAETVTRFVQLSSSEVYGSAKYVPMDEDHPISPHSTYAVSKLASARLALLSHKEHGFPATVVRPFNSYGPNVTQPYIIPEIIVQLLNGNTTIQLGNVESSRDFTYVSDTARAILLAAVKDAVVGEVINVGSGRVITISDLAYLIASIMGVEIEVVQDETRLRPFDVTRLVCDWGKAKRLLSWYPEVTLDDGLKKVVDWLRNKQDIVQNWVPYTERKAFEGPLLTHGV